MIIKKIAIKIYNFYHYFILKSYLPSFLKKLLIKNGSSFKYIGQVFINNYIGLFVSKGISLQNDVEIFAYGTVILGKNTLIAKGTKIKAYKNGYFKCGKNFVSGKNSDIDATGRVIIGDNVVFSDKVCTISHKHLYQLEYGLQKEEKKHQIFIEDNCWIGYDVLLLPDTHIKKSSIVAAKSVVTCKNIFLEKSLILGSPAKTVKILEKGYY